MFYFYHANDGDWREYLIKFYPSTAPWDFSIKLSLFCIQIKNHTIIVYY